MLMMQQATSSTGRLESRWLTPWWNQLRTWRSIPSLSYSLHPLLFFSFHFHFFVSSHWYTPCCLSLIPFSHFLCHTSSSHTLSSLASVSTRSTIKCECLQLILNYFKLFLLLPSEEVRNLSPPNFLCKPKVLYMLCKPKVPYILFKTQSPIYPVQTQSTAYRPYLKT